MSQIHAAKGKRSARWFSGLSQDVRMAVRLFAATPFVSLVAVLSLALGVGSNTAIFSLINSVYLRPLPVENPNELVYVTGPTLSGRAGHQVAQRLRESPDVFDRSAAYSETQFDISSDNEAQWVDGLWASGSFFATMGVAPVAGRFFTPQDDVEGGGADGLVAVISHSLWQRQYTGARDAIGRVMDVNHVPVTIVGVAPANFFGPNVGRSFDVVVPLGAAVQLLVEEMPRPGDEVVARLRDGQTPAAATAALQALFATEGGGDARSAGFASAVRAVPAATGQSPVRGEYRRPLLMLMALGMLVLLIACANVANLMLAWSTARRHERSLRLALGASYWRIVRQCSVESLLLATVSAGGGLVVAYWATRLLLRELAARDALTTGEIGYGSARLVLDTALDWRVAAFTVGLALLTALLFGVAPALRSLRAAPADALKESNALVTQAGAASARFGALRVGASGWILVAQVALSLTLVVSAGLFVRSFTLLSNVDLGLDASRAVLVNVQVPGAGEGATPLDHEALLDRIRTLPNVAGAAVSMGSPPVSSGVHEMIAVAGADAPEDPHSTANLVTPDWFAALGLSTTAGRLFDARDVLGAPRVAVVNEAFVRTFLGGGNALGRTITSFEAPVEIVGVVGDVVSGFLRDRPAPAVYLPLAQRFGRLEAVYDLYLAEQGLLVTVRADTAAPPSALTRSIGATVQALEPRAVLTFRYLEQQIAALTAHERVLAMLSAFFGGLALLLAALGLYGLVAYAVGRQRREIAIRIALGARPLGVVQGVLARVLALIGVGVVLGAALSVWSGRFFSALLYGIEATDVSVFVGAALGLVAGGLAVAWLPARGAAGIDPAVVLRYE